MLYFFTSPTRAQRPGPVPHPSELSLVTFMSASGSQIPFAAVNVPGSDHTFKQADLDSLANGKSWKKDGRFVVVPNDNTASKLAFSLSEPLSTIAEIHVYTTNDESFGNAPCFLLAPTKGSAASGNIAKLFVHYEAEGDRVLSLPAVGTAAVDAVDVSEWVMVPPTTTTTATTVTTTTTTTTVASTMTTTTTVAEPARSMTSAEIAAQFRLYDVDGDGFLSHEEFRAMLLGHGSTMSASDVREIITDVRAEDSHSCTSLCALNRQSPEPWMKAADAHGRAQCIFESRPPTVRRERRRRVGRERAGGRIQRGQARGHCGGRGA